MGANTLFRKVQDVGSFFTKTANDHNLFRKIGNTARKFDNSIARVGNFLVNTADTVGLGALRAPIKTAIDATHDIRNNLEKSIHKPMNEIRNI